MRYQLTEKLEAGAYPEFLIAERGVGERLGGWGGGGETEAIYNFMFHCKNYVVQFMSKTWLHVP
jgi:hypothetical protein